MKKLLSAILLIVAACGASAQTPVVEITTADITATTITCSFAKNEACTRYCILASEPGIVEQYIGSWFGSTLEEVIASWAIACTADTTYTWDEQTPGTTYVIYALAYSNDSQTLYTDTLNTTSLGGHGTSIITLSVTNIGDTTATTTAIPNEETAFFKDFLFESGMLDTLPLDTIVDWMRTGYDQYYSTDTWDWLTLKAGTEYIFMAQGQNADGIWGDLAQFTFTTTGTPLAINSTANNRITIHAYPNPAADILHIDGLQPQSRLYLCDIQGRLLIQQSVNSSSQSISLQNLRLGTYILRALIPGSVPQTMSITVAR